MSSQSVSIIVPTRHEVENIGPLVSQIVAQGISFREILFIDDDSTDGTRESIQSLSRNYPIRLIEQNPDEPGLAAAIMAGAAAAEGDLLVVMDADLSHPPDRIKDLLAPLDAGIADMVIGSRYINGGSIPAWPLWRRVLSRAGSALAYPLTKQHDSMSGFFAITRSRLLEINPPTVGFKIAFETILRGGASLRVSEIPIAFHDRARGQSKMSLGIALRFLYRWLLAVFRRGFSPNPKPRHAKSEYGNN
jgi:dolichol-phosphate mannosyltransferase